MSIDQKIFNTLKTLVGVDSDGRKCVYPATLPQLATYPAIAYQLISGYPSAITQAAAFSDFHFQITIHAPDYAGLMTLRASVLGALRAMPEFITYTELPRGYEFELEPKAFNAILDVQFRDTET